MAIFTAIGATIAGWLGMTGTFATIAGVGLSFAGTLVAGVVAAGLSMATAKVLGVFKKPGMANANDPGVKVQLEPSTDNKVPVFYGTNLTSGLITDAGISNSNKTMTYVIVLGEETDSGTYTVGTQYRGDWELNFGTTTGTRHIVQSITDANATSATDITGKMRCRIYAGGTASGNQIFPLIDTPVAATTLLSTIDGDTSYEGLAYAVFQMDYDQENGLTALGQYTAEITNDLNEPGAVLTDYLLNSRYGAGLSASDIDSTSIAALTTHCEELVAYQNSSGGAETHPRWEINGMMGTYGDVFTNIDLICQACSTFFTYNPKVGKFEVVPNREATTGEKSAAYVFTDDNVIGAIDVTSTQLYAQYNEIEAEYPDGTERDQTNTVYVSTPGGELNANEPTNKLTTRYPICNDSPRVTNLALIDLRQSRKDLVVQLEADYEAIQSDVGDIVKLTNTTYDFSEKLFRVMRVTEKESENGMLSVNLVLLEYDDSVYTHETVRIGGDLPATGIPGIWTLFANSLVTVGNITVADNQNNVAANIVYSGNNDSTGTTIDYANIVLPMAPSTGDIGGPFLSVPVTPATNTYWPQMHMKVTPVMVGGAEGTPTVNIYGQNANALFSSGETSNVGVDLKFLSNNQRIANVASVRMEVNAHNPYIGISSRITETANITFDSPGILKESMATFGAGTQLQAALADKVDLTQDTSWHLLAATDEFPIAGSAEGSYAFSSSATPIGGLSSGSYDLGFKSNIVLTFHNGVSSAERNIVESGTTKTFPTASMIPSMFTAQEFSTDPTAQDPALTSDYYITDANVSLYGYSTLETSGGERGFAEMVYNTVKINKGAEE